MQHSICQYQPKPVQIWYITIKRQLIFLSARGPGELKDFVCKKQLTPPPPPPAIYIYIFFY